MSRRAYHLLSGGFFLNEIFRRVDPERRTIGKFIESEVRAAISLVC